VWPSNEDAHVAGLTFSNATPDDATPEHHGVGGLDARFTSAEYAAMLEEARNYLPAFLSPAATEHHHPAGDVRELLRLTDNDLDRLVAVHVCLSDDVRRFIDSIDAGLRRPLTSTERPEELTQAVRGPIDWGATIRRRSLAGFNPSMFVVRPGRRLFDTPENQVLVWAIRTLTVLVGKAIRSLADAEPGSEAHGWTDVLLSINSVLLRAQRVEWLRQIPPSRPTLRVRQRLGAARLRFYRQDLSRAVDALLRAERRDAATLTELLCRRYFRPDKAWRLFEVLVCLRLAREFAKSEYSTSARRTRLLAGAAGVAAYARYEIADGGTVALTYQGWPDRPARSERLATGRRHGFSPKSSVPDLFITRTNSDGDLVDAIVLELKATKRPGYLGEGLSQLLGYLGDRSDLFSALPAGWLVAPPSSAFHPADPEPGARLWVVDASEVAARAAARMTS
jgi:hypothetical protein